MNIHYLHNKQTNTNTHTHIHTPLVGSIGCPPSCCWPQLDSDRFTRSCSATLACILHVSAWGRRGGLQNHRFAFFTMHPFLYLLRSRPDEQLAIPMNKVIWSPFRQVRSGSYCRLSMRVNLAYYICILAQPSPSRITSVVFRSKIPICGKNWYGLACRYRSCAGMGELWIRRPLPTKFLHLTSDLMPMFRTCTNGGQSFLRWRSCDDNLMP